MRETLFHEYDDLLPALTQVFNGTNSADMVTLMRGFGVDRCAGLGRGENDCPENQYVFGDSGFHEDFWDHGTNQIFHVWPYIANTGGAYSFGGAGLSIAQFGNFFHEKFASWWFKRTDFGASWNDYFLSQAGMEIGVAITNGEIAPNELADYVYRRLGRMV